MSEAKEQAAPFLDTEEKDFMDSFDAALDAGLIKKPTKAEREALNQRWQASLKASQERKSVTLRLQQGDVSKLKIIAKRRGIPYQTLISSILHQYANGDLSERS